MIQEIEIGITTTLTDWEQKLCKIQSNLQRKINNHVHIQQIAADLAYCKVNNIYPYEHLELSKQPWKQFRGNGAEQIEDFVFFFDVKDEQIDFPASLNSMVALNRLEQEFCRLIAPQRTQASRAANLENRRVDKTRSDEQIEVHGLGGEFAFCKLFNLYPSEQFTIMARLPKDDYGDAVMQNGLVVDVKSTVYHTGRLLIMRWKKGVGIDCYALMTGPLPTYTFRGFASKTMALNPERIGRLKADGAEGFITSQSELCDLRTLSQEQEQGKDLSS